MDYLSLLTFCLVFLATLITPPFIARADPIAQSSITLGGIFDLSGDGKVWGKTELNAFQMAIGDYRTQGGKLRVQSKIEDCHHDNNKGISSFQKLTSIDGIKYIVGPTWEVFVATMPLCESKHVICFAPSHNGIGFQSPSRPLKYSFSAYFDERGYGELIAQEINRLKLTKVAIVSANTAYHDTVTDHVLNRLMTKAVSVERINDSERDFRTIILRASPDIDGLVVLLQAEQIPEFLKQWAQLRKDKPVMFSDDTLTYLTAEQAGMVKGLGLDISCAMPKEAPDADPTWNQRYKNRFGAVPESPNGPIVYDEVQLLLACIEKAPATIEVSNCLRTTSNYRGQSGTISFGGTQTVTARHFELIHFN